MDYYTRLVDCVVFDVELEEDDFEDTVYPILMMMHPDGRVIRVAVLSDEEGNGAGFLDLEEVK
jgi:hypothetical protein